MEKKEKTRGQKERGGSSKEGDERRERKRNRKRGKTKKRRGKEMEDHAFRAFQLNSIQREEKERE